MSVEFYYEKNDKKNFRIKFFTTFAACFFSNLQ